MEVGRVYQDKLSYEVFLWDKDTLKKAEAVSSP